MWQVVPPIAVQMIKNPDVLQRFDLTCVKDIRNGAATFPPGVEKALLQYLPHIKYVRQGEQSELYKI